MLGRLAVRLRPVGPAVLVECPGCMLVQLRRLGLLHSRPLVRLLGMLVGLHCVGLRFGRLLPGRPPGLPVLELLGALVQLLDPL